MEISLKLTEKLSSCCLDFAVPNGAVQVVVTENTSKVLPSVRSGLLLYQPPRQDGQ